MQQGAGIFARETLDEIEETVREADQRSEKARKRLREVGLLPDKD